LLRKKTHKHKFWVNRTPKKKKAGCSSHQRKKSTSLRGREDLRVDVKKAEGEKKTQGHIWSLTFGGIIWPGGRDAACGVGEGG